MTACSAETVDGEAVTEPGDKDPLIVRVVYYAHRVGANLIIIGAGLLGVVFLITAKYGYFRDEKTAIIGWVVLLTGIVVFACGKIYIKKYLQKRRENAANEPSSDD
jgi:drug/metabolite transporter (DMT)-like permease